MNFRLALRVILGSAGIVGIVACMLYAGFWLPFRNPGSDKPRLLEILHVAEEPARSSRENFRYEWVDRAAGIVRIPVEEAMILQVQRLPVRKGAVEAAEERARQRIPTDAGSGRAVTSWNRVESSGAPD